MVFLWVFRMTDRNMVEWGVVTVGRHGGCHGRCLVSALRLRIWRESVMIASCRVTVLFFLELCDGVELKAEGWEKDKNMKWG